jgi:hypothetical protein
MFNLNRVAKLVFCAGSVGLSGATVAAQSGEAVPPSVSPSLPASVSAQTGNWLESSVRYSLLPLITGATSSVKKPSDSGIDRQQDEADGPPQQSRPAVHSYMQTRTAVVHPQPSVLRATRQYVVTVPSYTDADWSVVAALDKPLPAEGVTFEEMSLRDLATWAGGKLNCAVRFDHKVLEGIDPEEPIITETERFSGTDYRHVLRGALGTKDLDFYVEDGGLVLTTKGGGIYFACYPLPSDCNPVRLCEDLAAVVQPTAWDAQGGQGTIRFMADANVILVSNTQEVHEEVESFLRGFDQDLQPAQGNGAHPERSAIRIHTVHDPKTLRELEASLVGLCNATLGPDRDPAAKAMVIGGKLVVQSSSRPFQVYAAEVVRAIEGVEVVTREVIAADGDDRPAVQAAGGFGGNSGQGGGFCWVAREVYGTSDARWLRFRDWMLTMAPGWLQTAYSTQGRSFAEWLRTRPVAKCCVRAAMDQAIGGICP